MLDLLAASNNPTAAAVLADINALPDNDRALFSQLPAPTHQLLTLELLAALKVTQALPEAKCSICSATLHTPNEVLEHVAEHARPSLLDITALGAFCPGTDLTDVVLFLRNLPVRAAVEVLDGLMEHAMYGEPHDLDTLLAQADLICQQCYTPSPAGPSSGAGRWGTLFHNFDVGGANYSVAGWLWGCP